MISIQERIIDYHLEANFSACQALADLFAEAVMAQAGIKLPRQSREARCSPSRRKPNAPKGQTDIGLYFSDGTIKTVLLVENKIFSPFTHRQPERYCEEAEWLMKDGGYAHAVPVLLCPERYRNGIRTSVEKFPVCVTYEQLADRLPTQGWRRDVLRAIERCESGLITIEVPEVTTNFAGYKFLLGQMRPDIEMITSTESKGGRARTVRFSVDLGEGVRSRDCAITLLHQWRERRAKILLDGSRLRADRSALEERMKDDGRRFGMELDPNDSGSIGLFLWTPQIVNDGPWDAQIEAAIIGINNVGCLADWLRNNSPMWRTWLEPMVKPRLV